MLLKLILPIFYFLKWLLESFKVYMWIALYFD